MVTIVKKIKRSYKKFDKAKLEDELPYPYLVFKQLDRMALAMTEGTQAFLRAVEVTEILVFPFIDDEYKTALEKIEENYKNIIIEITQGRIELTPEQEYKKTVTAYEKAKLKMKILMELINRIGMLPDKEKPWREEEKS